MRQPNAAEIKVKADSTVTIKVLGSAVVRIESAGRQPDHAAEGGATMAGLAEAIGLLTARVHGMTSPGLSRNVAPSAVAAALALLGAAFISHLLPADRGAGLLRDFGAAAAGEDGTSTGKGSSP
jgi:hypothetical protein